MANSIQSIKGTFDILPNTYKSQPWQDIALWKTVEKKIHQICENYDILEIRTPIIEPTELFNKGTGESSDIVMKEMYTFLDKGERSNTLRPEGTPSVLRSVLEHTKGQTKLPVKHYYVGPMFRYERPQSGRFRQFHQFGVEILGSSEAYADVEMITMIYQLLTQLGIKDVIPMINTLGDSESRLLYRQALLDYLKPFENQLSQDSQRRLQTNPMRILDSKDPADKEILKQAPTLDQYLNNASLEHFEKVKTMLTKLGIPFKIDPKLVRGLDYYCHTVFEFVCNDIGAQGSLGAGGRYDGLSKQLGGPNWPAVGFAIGMERLLMTMINQGIHPIQNPVQLMIIPMGDLACEWANAFAFKARSENISLNVDYSNQKLKNALQVAADKNIPWVLIIGENELSCNTFQLKHMPSKQVYQLKDHEIIEKIMSGSC